MKTNNRGWTSVNRISHEKRLKIKNAREEAQSFRLQIILEQEKVQREILAKQLIELRKKYN